MPDGPPGWKLRQIARKTLSRDADDLSSIPYHYLQVLMKHLENYPLEENFLMDLKDGGGTITCLDCWSEVPVANSQGQLEGLNAFWTHIANPQHQELASHRINGPCTPAFKQELVDPEDMNTGTHYFPSDTAPVTFGSSFPSSSNATNPRKRTRRLVELDGMMFEYSSDEEDGPQAAPAQQATGTPSTSYSPYSQAWSGSQTSSSAGTSTSTPDRNFPLKRPRRGIRRYEFQDGDTVYVSTDDENVDERPDAMLNKKPRLGGALIKTEDGIIKTEDGVIKAESRLVKMENGSSIGEGSSSGFLQRAGNVAMDAYRAVTGLGEQKPDVCMDVDPAPVAYEQYPYQGFDPALAVHPHAYPAFLPTSDPVYYDDEPNPQQDWPGEFGMPGGIGMGYHAPSVPDTNPVMNNAAGYVQRHGAGSFNLDFDEEGPMGRIDMGGADQAQKLKDFFISAMEDFQEMPKVVDAAHKLGLETTSDFIPGLEVQLMPHQLIGVSWMVEQEAKPIIRGGILADDMGLGKTVQCIAMCVKNMPAKGSERNSTLVVAPAALLEQWAVEFRQRTLDGKFRVHIHHGKDKLRSTTQVQQYDVVLTTYQTLCADFPKDKKGKGKATADPDYGDSEGEGADVLGPLAATMWHRVVLDEAQCIRNRVTRSSRCVARLDSTYRWALTGTPVTNTLADIYGLVRFLQFRPFNDWKEFNEKIARVQRKQPDLAGQRAQALLKKCLLRRTKNTKLEGRPILQLPPKHIEVLEVEFSPEERKIYSKIEERQKQKMSKFLKAGTVMKNYAVVLVMLLRLRQVCNHPQLIASDEYDLDGERVVEDDGGEGGDPAAPRIDTSPLGELKRAERLLGAQFVEEAKAKLREQAQARIQAEADGTGVAEEDTDCPICFDTFVSNCRMTSCKHMFCGDCLNDLFKSPPTGLNAQDAAYAEAVQNSTRCCPVCRGQIHPQRVFKASAFEPSPTELDFLRAAIKGTTFRPMEIIDLTRDDTPPRNDFKGKGKANIKDETDLDELNLGSLDRGDDFEPSAKMLKMIELIRQWHQTAPDDKIICYSQWTSMINLVEKLLARDNIRTVRFDGKMSRMARDIAVAQFKKRRGPSIMLISLKCGGVGLNLVEANRVLCLDLAWNAATENQAFDRVHRMGQQKDVHVKRLIIRNTVEERILNLQATKQSLADAALGEGKAAKIKKMSVGELKALFGM